MRDIQWLQSDQMDTDGYDHSNTGTLSLFLCFNQYPSISNTWYIQANPINIVDIPTQYRMKGKVNWSPVPYTVIPYSFFASIHKPYLHWKDSLSSVISYAFGCSALGVIESGVTINTENEYGITVYGTGDQLTFPFIRYWVGMSTMLMRLACMYHVLDIDGYWSKHRKRERVPVLLWSYHSVSIPSDWIHWISRIVPCDWIRFGWFVCHIMVNIPACICILCWRCSVSRLQL